MRVLDARPRPSGVTILNSSALSHPARGLAGEALLPDIPPRGLHRVRRRVRVSTCVAMLLSKQGAAKGIQWDPINQLIPPRYRYGSYVRGLDLPFGYF